MAACKAVHTHTQSKYKSTQCTMCNHVTIRVGQCKHRHKIECETKIVWFQIETKRNSKSNGSTAVSATTKTNVPVPAIIHKRICKLSRKHCVSMVMMMVMVVVVKACLMITSTMMTTYHLSGEAMNIMDAGGQVKGQFGTSHDLNWLLIMHKTTTKTIR